MPKIIYWICLSGLTQFAMGNPIAFWASSFLLFTTGPLVLYPNVCSSVLSVQITLNGRIRKAGHVSSVSLASSSPNTSFYLDDACTTSAVTSIPVTATATSVSFYTMTTDSSGSQTIKASMPNVNPVSQTETAAANPYVWTGAVGDGAWSTSGNWSGITASPGPNDIATFDGNCVSCSVNISSNTIVGGILMRSSYSGTITQASGAKLTLNRYFNQSTGTFAGGDSAIQIGGSFVVSAGSFKSTSGTLEKKAPAPWLVSGSPTFNANGGTIQFDGNSMTITPGSVTYANVYLSGGSATWTVSGTWTIANNLSHWSNNTLDSLNGGTLNISGNYTGLYRCALFGSATLSFTGSTDQIIDLTAYSGCNLPNLTIASTGGTVHYKGYISIGGSNSYATYSVSSGVVDTGTSTVYISGNYYGLSVKVGSESYYNFGLYNANSTATISNPVTVTGLLTLGSYNSFNGQLNGTINAQGGVRIFGYGYRSGGSGGYINVTGSASQSIDASDASTYPPIHYGNIPNLTIDSSGGTISLTGSIWSDRTYTYTAGSLNSGSGSSMNIWAEGGSSNFFNPGTLSYQSFVFGGSGTIAVKTSLNAAGNITFGNGSGLTVNMPTSGGSYSISSGGTLTAVSGTTLNLHGASYSPTPFAGAGTVNN